MNHGFVLIGEDELKDLLRDNLNTLMDAGSGRPMPQVHSRDEEVTFEPHVGDPAFVSSRYFIEELVRLRLYALYLNGEVTAEGHVHSNRIAPWVRNMLSDLAFIHPIAFENAEPESPITQRLRFTQPDQHLRFLGLDHVGGGRWTPTFAPTYLEPYPDSDYLVVADLRPTWRLMSELALEAEKVWIHESGVRAVPRSTVKGGAVLDLFQACGLSASSASPAAWLWWAMEAAKSRPESAHPCHGWVVDPPANVPNDMALWYLGESWLGPESLLPRFALPKPTRLEWVGSSEKDDALQFTLKSGTFVHKLRFGLFMDHRQEGYPKPCFPHLECLETGRFYWIGRTGLGFERLDEEDDALGNSVQYHFPGLERHLIMEHLRAIKGMMIGLGLCKGLEPGSRNSVTSLQFRATKLDPAPPQSDFFWIKDGAASHPHCPFGDHFRTRLYAERWVLENDEGRADG